MNGLQTFRFHYLKSSIRYHVATFVLGYPMEAWSLAKSAFAKTVEPDKKFVIFTDGRSGSTLLVDLLNANPAVHCDDELLKRRVLFPMKQIDLHARQSAAEVYGFKLLSYQLKNVQISIRDKQAFMRKLAAKGYQIIYLHRENKVLQALSIVYAFYHNKWHNRTDGKPPKKTTPFEMDLDVFYRFLDGMMELENFEQAMLANLPHLKISYEKHLQHGEAHLETVQQLADFLDIPVAKPKTTLRKATPSRLEKYILNREELLESLRQRPEYAHYVPMLEAL